MPQDPGGPDNEERRPADGTTPAGQADWQRAYRRHPRSWQKNQYVYPVLSRRARGISIGININPDQVCNFNCAYCQVERSPAAAGRTVDLDVLRRELDEMLGLVRTGALFQVAPFVDAPEPLRRVADIAFSGDAEPTRSPVFGEAVRIVVDVRRAHGLSDEIQTAVLTNAALLRRPAVYDALDLLGGHGGVVWAKLDAGTQERFEQINRCRTTLQEVVGNIAFAARRWRVLIQSMWVRLHGQNPDDAEVEAFAARLNEVLRAGGRLEYVQIYGLARPPAEPYVAALPEADLRRIAGIVASRTGLPVEVFPSPEDSGEWRVARGV